MESTFKSKHIDTDSQTDLKKIINKDISNDVRAEGKLRFLGVEGFRVAIGVLLLSFALSGCGNDKKSSAGIDARGGSPRAAAGSLPTDGSLQLRGVVYADEAYQDDFNELVRDFLSATVPRDYVGYVSARAANNTGVFLGGRVQLSSGSIRNASTNRVNISSNSQLLIAVYDSFPNASAAPLPPVYFNSSSGYVTGNYAYLKFSDGYGFVELVGQFDASSPSGQFVGELRFDNQRNHDGSSPGRAGTIGLFQVPTCQFFVCN